MKTILVPTDFSDYAYQATRAAVQLAAAAGANLILQHNIFTDTLWETLPSSRKVDYPETRKRIEEATNKMNLLLKSNLFKNVKATSVFTYGVGYEQIITKAKQVKADVIIMGSHGNEQSGRYFIGSTIQKVLREATCPVMTIPKHVTPKRWKNLLVACDLDRASYKPFEKIKNLAISLRATVYLMVVNSPADFKDTRTLHKLMNNFVARYPELKFHKIIYDHEEVEEGILHFIEDYPMDWVAVLTKNRKHKPRYVIGTTEALAFQSTIPVLSVSLTEEPLKMN